MKATGSRSGPKAVTFCEQPKLYIEPSPQHNSGPQSTCPNMEEQVFKKYDGAQVTDSILQEAAALFSENYGVWGEQADGKFTRPGKFTVNPHFVFIS